MGRGGGTQRERILYHTKYGAWGEGEGQSETHTHTEDIISHKSKGDGERERDTQRQRILHHARIRGVGRGGERERDEDRGTDCILAPSLIIPVKSCIIKLIKVYKTPPEVLMRFVFTHMPAASDHRRLVLACCCVLVTSFKH